MELIQIQPNLLVNMDLVTSVRKALDLNIEDTPDGPIERAPIPAYYIGLSDGREFRVADPSIIRQIDDTIVLGQQDDPMTQETPRTLIQKLLGLFRR